MKIKKRRSIVIIISLAVIFIAVYLYNLFTFPIFILHGTDIKIPSALNNSQTPFNFVFENGLLGKNHKMLRSNIQLVKTPLQILNYTSQLITYVDTVKKTVNSVNPLTDQNSLILNIDKVHENTVIWNSILQDNKLYLVLLRINNNSNYNPGNYGFTDSSVNVDRGILIPGSDPTHGDSILAIYNVNDKTAQLDRELTLTKMEFPLLISINDNKSMFISKDQNYSLDLNNGTIINTTINNEFYKKINCISALDQSNTLSFINDGPDTSSFVMDSKKYKQTTYLPFPYVYIISSGLTIRGDSIYLKDETLLTCSITKSILNIRYLHIF